MAPCRGTSSALPGKAATKLATVYCCCGVDDLRGGCKTAGCKVGDLRGGCKTAGSKVDDLGGGRKTAGCKASREPARGPRGLLLRGCRTDESAGPVRGLMLRGCRTHEDAGTAAGADEDGGTDANSGSHSAESSTGTDGARNEKPTNSGSHSAESSTGTDGAGTEKLSSPSNQSGESESAPAM